MDRGRVGGAHVFDTGAQDGAVRKVGRGYLDNARTAPLDDEARMTLSGPECRFDRPRTAHEDFPRLSTSTRYTRTSLGSPSAVCQSA